jgi:hypothetical protein
MECETAAARLAATVTEVYADTWHNSKSGICVNLADLRTILREHAERTAALEAIVTPRDAEASERAFMRREIARAALAIEADETTPPIEARITSMEAGPDDAAECKRLRTMLRALIESGSTAKMIVMVGIGTADGDMTATITTPNDAIPERWIADAVAAGYGKIMSAYYEAAKAEAEGATNGEG